MALRAKRSRRPFDTFNTFDAQLQTSLFLALIHNETESPCHA